MFGIPVFLCSKLISFQLGDLYQKNRFEVRGYDIKKGIALLQVLRFGGEHIDYNSVDIFTVI